MKPGTVLAAVFLLGLVGGCLGPATGTGVHAAVSMAPSFQSSVPTVFFTGALFNYVLTSSIPVNWTKVSGPAGFTLAGGPLSTQADLQGTVSSAGSQSFSIQITGALYQGGLSAWQNWTTTFLAEPFISSVPYFTPSAGSYYDYRPTAANAGGASWSFSGASWLTLNPTTGELTGTVAPGSFENQLTLNTSVGQWTQAWFTSNVGLSSTITFRGWIGHHLVTATEPTTDSTGMGNGGLFLGSLVQAAPWSAASTENYTITVGNYSRQATMRAEQEPKLRVGCSTGQGAGGDPRSGGSRCEEPVGRRWSRQARRPKGNEPTTSLAAEGRPAAVPGKPTQ